MSFLTLVSFTDYRKRDHSKVHAYTHVADTSHPHSPLLCCPAMQADWVVTFRCEQRALQKACQPIWVVCSDLKKSVEGCSRGDRLWRGDQHLKKEASWKSQELCLRQADWSPWCQAMRLDRWAKFKRKKKKFISTPEIMLRLLRSRKQTANTYFRALPLCVAGYAYLGFQFLGGDCKIAGHSACPGGWAAASLYHPSLIFALNLQYQKGGCENFKSLSLWLCWGLTSISSQLVNGLARQEPASHREAFCGCSSACCLSLG